MELSKELTEYAGKRFRERLVYLQDIGKEVEEKLDECEDAQRALLMFYYATMPLSDAFTYEFELFRRFAEHALFLRAHAAWCAVLPEEIFLHYVAYYRVNSERIEDCRHFFWKQVSPLVEGMEAERAVLEANYWCASCASYEAGDERTQSPLSVWRSGSGRCGEESVFLVSVLRSLGIPARQVYVPRWAHCDDNHAWVEVWVDGTWRFLGACEPEEMLDRGWFIHAASRAPLVYARIFSDYGFEKEILGRDGCVCFLNVTGRYARVRRARIRVLEPDGRPAEGADVSLHILNMAEWENVLNLQTGEEGEACLEMGLADVLICVKREELHAQRLVRAGERTITLTLERGEAGFLTQGWEDWEVRAPEDAPMGWPVPDEEKKRRGRLRLAGAAALRERRLAAYDEAARRASAAYPQEADILYRARGNVRNLVSFLIRPDRKEERKGLLHTLSDKDARDADIQTLQAHLDGAWTTRDRIRVGTDETAVWGRAPEEIYVRYCLAPRILTEELTDYRSAVEAFFTQEQKERFRNRPKEIWAHLEETFSYVPKEDYDTLLITPPAALKGRWADERGRRVLFVAVCRTLGIPARINPATGEAEYLEGECWKTAVSRTGGKTARLFLEKGERDSWRYGQDWTIGRLCGTRFVTLRYGDIPSEEEGIWLELTEGIYRLITTVRMPNGDQHAAVSCFRLEAGTVKRMKMRLRRGKLQEMRMKNPLPDFGVKDQTGKESCISNFLFGSASLLIFLKEGEEPTEHVLGELLAEKERLERSGCRLLLIAGLAGTPAGPLLAKLLKEIPGAQLLEDENLENAEPVARRMYVDPDKLPLLVAADELGQGIYACSGYHVGSVSLALELLNS